MHLLAVSPESEYADEPALVVRLFDAGLARYHLRKPDWSREQCAEWLQAIPMGLHALISVHQHHDLAKEFGVGLHFRDDGQRLDHEARFGVGPLVRSRSLHELERLSERVEGMAYTFLSPIFASISKQGYKPDWTEAELRAALAGPRSSKLYALGGITAENLAQVGELGFDGAVLHGCLWQANDPIAAFDVVRKEAL